MEKDKNKSTISSASKMNKLTADTTTQQKEQGVDKNSKGKTVTK